MIDLAALFPYSIDIELLLIELKRSGIPKERLLVVPLTKDEPYLSIDAIGKAGTTQWDTAFVLGTIFMLLGTIYGFQLTLGPVLWGLFGLLGGLAAGIAIQYGYNHRKYRKHYHQGSGHVLILIKCPKEDEDKLRRLFTLHNVSEVGVV